MQEQELTLRRAYGPALHASSTKQAAKVQIAQYAGLCLVIDPSLPTDRVEVRDGDKLLAIIANIGPD